MTGTIAFAFFITGITLGINKAVSFCIEHGIQGFFNTVFYEILSFSVDKFLIKVYNVVRHSSLFLSLDFVW